MPQEAQAPNSKDVDYVLGTSDRERQRLIAQARQLHEQTLDAFRWGGIAPGMRVLDVGCGAGDVAMLAADLVGPAGRVLTIDHDAANLAFAQQRAAQAGYANIEFRAAEIDTFTDAQPFDAIVGRYILLFLPDRAGALRGLLHLLRSGGSVVMVEPDFSLPFPSLPLAPLFDKVGQWIRAVVAAGNIHVDSGPRLLSVFRDAGLTGTKMDCRQWVGGGPGYEVYALLAELVHSMVPAMEKHGITTREEADTDTLAARLEAEAVALGSVLFSYRSVSAWARRP